MSDRTMKIATPLLVVILIGVALSARQVVPPPDAPRDTRPPVPRTPPADPVQTERGAAIWVRECIDCHGAQARGSDTGPNIIRTTTVNFDRSSPVPGSVLGPFLAKSHPTQTGTASSAFTPEEVIALAHFLRQRVNDTMRGSPLFTAGDILVGDRYAGEEYFKLTGKCIGCHNESRGSLAGIGKQRPFDIQQRMLFPGAPVGGRGAPAPPPIAIAVTVTQAEGAPLSGTLVEETDFFVTFRTPDGTRRTVRRTPEMKVVKVHPLQAHIDLLETITDEQIHDVVAYLESLK